MTDTAELKRRVLELEAELSIARGRADGYALRLGEVTEALRQYEGGDLSAAEFQIAIGEICDGRDRVVMRHYDGVWQPERKP